MSRPETTTLGVRVGADVLNALRAASAGEPGGLARTILGAWYEARETLPPADATPGGGLGYVLTAWHTLVEAAWRRLRSTFSDAELNLILDTLSGTLLTPQLAGQHLALEVHDAAHLSRRHEAHGVEDVAGLVERLRGLHPFDAHAVEVWASLWWATPGCDASSEEAQRVFRLLAQ